MNNSSAPSSTADVSAIFASPTPPGPNPLLARRLCHQTMRSCSINLPPSLRPILFDANGISELLDDETAIHCAANYDAFSLWSAKADPLPPLLTPSDAPLVLSPETQVENSAGGSEDSNTADETEQSGSEPVVSTPPTKTEAEIEAELLATQTAAPAPRAPRTRSAGKVAGAPETGSGE